MMELYDSALSPCAQKVRLALVEKGLTAELIPVDLTKKENLSPDYLKLNPKGVVPTLVEDGAVITESSIIIEYLDDTHPAQPLRPKSAVDRARMRTWIRLVDDEIHPANGAITWPILVLPAVLVQAKGDRDAAAAMVARVPNIARRERQMRFLEQGLEAPDTHEALGAFAKALDRMEAALQGAEWLAGPDYSLADIALTPYIQTYAQLGLWPLVRGERAAVAAWFERVSARPSFHLAIQASVPEATWAHVRQLGSAAAPSIERILAG